VLFSAINWAVTLSARGVSPIARILPVSLISILTFFGTVAPFRME
jgi:hypothetical protein